MINAFLTCGDTCALVPDLPTLVERQFCHTFTPEYSQICGIILLPADARGPDNWQEASDWESVIDNTDTTGLKAKYLGGVGSLPNPTKETITIGKNTRIVRNRLFRLSLETTRINDNALELADWFRCNYNKFRFWFETVEGRLFGGPTGITPCFTDADMPLGSGNADLVAINFIIEFGSTGLASSKVVDLTDITDSPPSEPPAGSGDGSGNVIGDPDSGEVIGDDTTDEVIGEN
jgi:hypothetical protein